jgi:putative toxin-antitoxin system antitoxin component (TIGR02293 family)
MARGAAISYAARLGVRVSNPLRLVEKINAGFPYRAFERLQRELDLSAKELADLVQVPPRTLARRKAQGRLRPDESERLLRISRVYDGALRLFEGDRQAARQWLLSPARALSGQVPLELAKTEIGAREVESLAARLERGVFS